MFETVLAILIIILLSFLVYGGEYLRIFLLWAVALSLTDRLVSFLLLIVSMLMIPIANQNGRNDAILFLSVFGWAIIALYFMTQVLVQTAGGEYMTFVL